MFYFIIASGMAVIILTIATLIHLELKGKSAKPRIILLGVLIVELLAAGWYYSCIRVFDYEFRQAFLAPVPQGEVLQMGNADMEVINSIKGYLDSKKDVNALIGMLNQFQLRTQGKFLSVNGFFSYYNAKEHAQQYNKLAEEIQEKNK